MPLHRRAAEKKLREFHARPRTLPEVIDLAMNFGGQGRFKLKTTQIRAEILWLADQVRALQPRVIVEIGTHRFGTLFIWSQLAAEAVITCDLVPEPALQTLVPLFPPPGSSCQIDLLHGDSHTPEFRERVIRALRGRAVDFLFIDGDHTEPGVEADYNDYRDLVRPGGIIAFHDISEQQILETNQVQHFWKRIRGQEGAEECIENPAQVGYGIGILRIP